MKGCAKAIQTSFKSKLPATEDKDLDASTALGKEEKLAKIQNAMAMAYATQCLSSTELPNVIFNVQAEAGWPTGKACQMIDNLKQKYNPNDKLLRMQMIKKLNKMKPNKGDDPKVMNDKIEALKVKYQDQVKIIDNDKNVMHIFLVCAKQYKSKLMQA